MKCWLICVYFLNIRSEKTTESWEYGRLNKEDWKSWVKVLLWYRCNNRIEIRGTKKIELSVILIYIESFNTDSTYWQTPLPLHTMKPLSKILEAPPINNKSIVLKMHHIMSSPHGNYKYRYIFIYSTFF